MLHLHIRANAAHLKFGFMHLIIRKEQSKMYERPANKSQVEISPFGSSKKATQKQAAEHLKIETAANQMV